MAKKRALIPKVTSLGELRQLAARDERYAKLLMAAAENLGGSPRNQTAAFDWLRLNAQETSERGVVAEVNACRDLIDEVSR